MSAPERSDPDAARATSGRPVPIYREEEAGRWLARLRERRVRESGTISSPVREILSEVRRDGDAALARLTERFDGVRPETLRVAPERCRQALASVPSRRRVALERARSNIRRFHAAQRREERRVEIEPGVTAWREFRPLERIGIYVPGGRAAYPSTLLMCAVPARVAGCGEIVACSPPGPGGEPAAGVMAVAALLEVDELYAVGGAQAVGALAFGTETIGRVDKLFGPGSRRVTEAKLGVHGSVAIDLPAGPSEVAVWADGKADPERVAAELLAQAEHGPDSLCVGILPRMKDARRVAARLESRLRAAPRRREARRSLEDSALLVAGDEETAVAWANELAPEHLVLMRADAESRVAEIRHAGSIFLGAHTPVAAGDYAIGTNHVLPTGGRARAAGGMSLVDFGRWMQLQRMEPVGLRALAPTIAELAEWEGLPAHADSVRHRTGDS